MSQILLDLGRTENAINLYRAKSRETLDANLAARKARQEAQSMTDGFDLSKVQGIAMNELLERRAKSRAEDADKS
jgi:hypothetical protein